MSPVSRPIFHIRSPQRTGLTFRSRVPVLSRSCPHSIPRSGNWDLALCRERCSAWNLCTITFPVEVHACPPHFVRDCRAVYLPGLRTPAPPLFYCRTSRSSPRPHFFALRGRLRRCWLIFLPGSLSTPKTRVGLEIIFAQGPVGSASCTGDPVGPTLLAGHPASLRRAPPPLELIQFSRSCVNSKRTPLGAGRSKTVAHRARFLLCITGLQVLLFG